MMNNKDCLRGIDCSVDSCKYNVSGNKCCADGIHVGNVEPSGQSTVDCTTYDPRG